MKVKDGKTAITFSNDVRKLVAKYVIWPVLIGYFVVMAVIVFLYSLSVDYSAKAECKQASSKFQEVVSAYEKQILSITEEVSIKQIINGKIYANNFSERVYSFINAQQIGAHFFVLNAEGELVLGSSTILSDYLLDEPPYNAGFMYRLQNNPNTVSKMLNTVGNARTSSMVLSIGKAIVKDEEIIGYFIFELLPEEILEYISTGEVGDVVVTNSFFTTLVTSKNEYTDEYSKLKNVYRGKSGSVKIEAQKFYIASEFLTNLDCWVFVIVKVGTFTKAIWITSVVAGIILIVSVLAIGGVGTKIFKDEASSIDKLLLRIKSMKEKGLFTPLEPIESKFSSLENSYNELIEGIRDLAESNRQEASMRERAEIKQLESQFNPHFIFNTLEIIRCYIKVDPVVANKMILDFSGLLRYSIDANIQFVPLEEDLQFIECYLSMNKMCSPDGLEYSLEVADEAKEVKVPKLCIQPIVENALKYSAINGKTKIKVSAYVKDGYLKVVVTDNGLGIDGSKLADIRKTLDQNQTPSHYFGLYNIHRRLLLIYGNRAGLELESQKGMKVTIKLPVE